MVQNLVDRLLAGDTAALSRIISRVERAEFDVPDILERLRPFTGKAHTIGITGPPGSGKSTVVDALTAHLRAQDRSVGVLAVDPSSPFTGGALLGDRLRMRRHYTDPHVFIRSMATRGALGGLPRMAKRVVKVLDAAGKDVILLETVGVGQTELSVMAAVDTVVVVLVPEAGDSIQTLKAGLLEVANLLVVNKADHTGARRLASDLEMSIMMGPQDTVWTIPVLLTQAIRNVGIPELWEAMEAHLHALTTAGHLESQRRDHRREEFFEVIQDSLARRLRQRVARDGHLADLLERVDHGQIDPYHAAQQALADRALLHGWLDAIEDEPSP